jgi:hypothetical protein
MNANAVIAGRANELLAGKRGGKVPVGCRSSHAGNALDSPSMSSYYVQYRFQHGMRAGRVPLRYASS